MKMIKNAIGRDIPEQSDGRKNIPFKGIGKHKPQDNKIGPPIPTGADFGKKVLKNIDEALDKLNIFNGMTLGFHHHLRNGDILVNTILQNFRFRRVTVAATGNYMELYLAIV